MVVSVRSDNYETAEQIVVTFNYLKVYKFDQSFLVFRKAISNLALFHIQFDFFVIVIETSPQELMKLLNGNPDRFTKCSFRIDTSVRPQGYYGCLPAPDSPDIKILGQCRGVYEDDIVVLDLQPDAKARDEKGQRQETAVVGHMKGEYKFVSLRSNKDIYNYSTTR